MRTLTTRNPDHPQNRLNAYKQSVKAKYRALSREQLDQLCATEGIDVSLPRHKKLDIILSTFEQKWKEQFEKVNGFAFDLIHQPAELSRVLAERDEKLRKEAIEHRPMHDGKVIAKEEFDKLPAETQHQIRLELHARLKQIKDSGYAGVTKTGGIVDRRAHPDALPVPENALLDIPEPKAIDAS